MQDFFLYFVKLFIYLWLGLKMSFLKELKFEGPLIRLFGILSGEGQVLP